MYEAQIARGVARLDTQYPGWRDRVNGATLMMSDPRRCILGQVTGNYYSPAARALVGLDAEDINITRYNDRMAEFGFACPGLLWWRWEALSQEWHQELKR